MQFRPWVQLLRPRQWIKNAFVFAPLFFAHRFFDPAAWTASIQAALAFLTLSCLIYIGNDARDVDEDRLHPVKQRRPLASGTVTMRQAAALAAAFATAALALFWTLPVRCDKVALVYLAFNLLYTLWLKRVAILDIFVVASGYVLRVLMGGYALNVFISPWIILTTFLLALFLGFGKRYHEMSFEAYAAAKPNLQQYSRPLLGQLVTMSGGAALITYAIYTTDIARQTGRVEIVYTVAFVAFGLFRYLQALYVRELGGEPESVVFKDKAQLLNVALWLLVTLWIMF